MDELFSKRIPITIKLKDQTNRNVIQVTMELHNITTPIHRKELIVRLTDETDLFFLYSLHLGEDDFHSLKSQQGLLVDFGAFPQKVIDLLNLCIQEQHRDSPKFILQLESVGLCAGEMSPTTLNIIETNPFKHLTHLALKFFPATDGDIKKYLASCLKQMKETNALLQQRLEHTDADLNHRLRQTQEALSNSTIELERLKSDWTSKITEISATHREQLNLEKEKALNKLTETQRKFESEKHELESYHQRITVSLESKVSELETATKELTDRKFRAESSAHELRSRVGVQDEEGARLKHELQALRRQNSELDAERHRQDKLVQQQVTSIAVLEQEVKDNQLVIGRSTEQLNSELDHKKKLEADVESKQREISRLENKVKVIADELKKGNEIIKKLQAEIKNYHAKIKLRSHIATEQEKVLAEKDEELEKVRQDLSSTKTELSDSKSEREILKTNLEATVRKLEESKQLLKTNENVIQWLNKQINENQIHHHMTSYDSTPDPSLTRRGINSASHNTTASSFGRPVSAESFPRVNRQPQVHYNAGVTPLTSAIPRFSVPLSARPHLSPNAPSNVPSSATNNNSQPVIDPRYLKKQDGAVPARLTPPPVSHGNHQPVTNPTQPTHSGQTSITSRPVVKPFQPPLASAYFPNNTKSV